jgi:hypothetical protein
MKYVENSILFARLAELADALDLGSSGRPCGFKSLIAHQKNRAALLLCFLYIFKGGYEVSLPENKHYLNKVLDNLYLMIEMVIEYDA